MRFSAPLSRLFAALLAAAGLLLAGGCYHRESTRTYSDPAAPDARLSTALVIVIQGECTEAQYLAWRGQVVGYLIERGYIASESELIGDPAQAQRVIRAIVGPDGFTLSVFHAENRAATTPDLTITDLYYPADPYFIFGFLYFGEIGPRRLPPRAPDYRPHPRPPGSPPPHYPRYNPDRPHPPRTNPGNWHKPPPDHRPTDPTPPPADRPHRPPGVTPPTPRPGHTPHLPPTARPDHPRGHPPEPGHPRATPTDRSNPPPHAAPPPPPASNRPAKVEREDEEKTPGRQEPAR